MLMRNSKAKYLFVCGVAAIGTLSILTPVFAQEQRNGRRTNPDDNQITITSESEEEGVITTTTDSAEQFRMRTRGNRGEELDCRAPRGQRGDLQLPLECELHQ